jgi:hypothetical protein
MFIYEHKNKRWGTVYLIADPRLVEDVRLEILVEAAEMYLAHEKKRKIKGDDYEGKITTERKYRTLGCYGGYEYHAELDTPNGKSETTFILMQQFNPAYN